MYYFVKKWSNRVQNISKHVNPSNIGFRKCSPIQYFLLMHVEESNTLEKKNLRKNNINIKILNKILLPFAQLP